MKKWIYTILMIFIFVGIVTERASGQSIAKILEGATGNTIDSKDLPPMRDPFIPQIQIPVQTPQQTTPPSKPEPKLVVPPQPTPVVPPLPPVVKKEEKPKAPDFKITGIVWNTKRPQAIINDQVFSVGNKINDYTIKSISKSGVSVTSGDAEYTIPY